MKKNICLLGVILLIALGIFLFGNIQSPDEYYLSHAEDITEDADTVTVSIICSSVLDHYDQLDKQLQDEKYVPSDGVILPETTMVLRKGDTAFELLSRACRYHEIQLDYQGTKKSAYIKGINYLYEQSCGPLSGWMFSVNDTYPGVGCGQYNLKNNDRLVWIYTCDLGNDIGNNYQEETK